MRLLLLSNSRQPGREYLEHAVDAIRDTLGPARRILFLPYAAVGLTHAEYQARVAAALKPLGCGVDSAHAVPDPVAAVGQADAVVAGGGNTFVLLRELRRLGLLAAVRARVAAGAPYIGWSAGANLAGPTIRTTNDMPVCDPGGLDALNLVPFQINPHYTDAVPAGWQGETRDQRIGELLALDPAVTVVGLPEGTGLALDAAGLRLVGSPSCRVFRHGAPPRDLKAGADLGFLLGDKGGKMPPE
ncbi:MAG: dipeptidase PepE [Burkholderiales bacterium]